jgi:hypothetical protein
MPKVRYSPRCGLPVPTLAVQKTLSGRIVDTELKLAALEDRLARAESQLRTIEMQDPRIGAEGWHDTIRRIVRDVLQESR